MRFAVLVAVLALAGCGTPEEQQAYATQSAERYLASLTIACRDGVQYLVGLAGNASVLTPRMKPDGTTYRCEVRPTQPSEPRQVPVD